MVNHDNDNNITFFSVCSGIEAASVAWSQLGWKCAGVAEIEKFPSAVLKHHYPDVKNHGDFTKVDVRQLPRIDVLCGGTPCQAFSVAGLRNSLQDARGNLSLEFVRLAHELANNNGLLNVIWENVVGVLSTKDNAFGCFLGGLVGSDAAIPPPRGTTWPNAGMVSGPGGRAAWRILDAQYFGLAQRRKRVIVVADFGRGADPVKVLFERNGVQRDFAPSREAREGLAEGFAASSFGGFSGGGGLGTLRAQNPQSSLVAYAPDIARCVATREGSSQDYESTTMVVAERPVAFNTRQDPIHGDVAPPLGAKDNGHGILLPPICFTAKDYGADATYDQSPTLRAGGHDKSHQNGGVTPAVTVALRGREGGATAELGGGDATALRASSGGGDKPHVLTFGQDHGGGVKRATICPTLTKEGPSGSAGGSGAEVLTLTSAVRRLTPKECERLQGFPDDYTNIPWRGKPNSPDGPRYKALGNSWAVPKFRWLGERVQRFMPPAVHPATNDNTQMQEAA